MRDLVFFGIGSEDCSRVGCLVTLTGFSRQRYVGVVDVPLQIHCSRIGRNAAIERHLEILSLGLNITLPGI